MAEIHHLRSRLDLHERRCREEAEQLGSRCHVNELRFSDSDIEAMAKAMAKITSGECGAVKLLLDEPLEFPGIPTAAEQALILEVEQRLGLPMVIQQPWWARHIALHRDLFVDVAVFNGDDADTAYLVVNALQNPVTV